MDKYDIAELVEDGEIQLGDFMQGLFKAKQGLLGYEGKSFQVVRNILDALDDEALEAEIILEEREDG